MKKLMIGMGLLALGGIGCASSTELENQSRVHSLRADAAAQSRDYTKAAREQEKAQELRNKAIERAAKEGRSDVMVPSEIPAPSTP